MESRKLVQVISREMIKPSTQTPPHLKKHNLSIFDQISPLMYIPIVLFYDSGTSITTSQKLKQSLSETLSTFYPLAGKLDRENMMVNCVDTGVNYVETRVLNASQLIQDYQTGKRNLDELKQYLPVVNRPSGSSDGNDVILHVQVSFFESGGFAIGVCLSHAVGDAASLLWFVNSWATCCRGKRVLPTNPALDLDSLGTHFPAAKGLSWNNILFSSLLSVGKSPSELVTKRIVFDKKKLVELRAASAVYPGSLLNNNAISVRNPSRVELVSAVVWKYFIRMAELTNVSNPRAFITVNLRNKVIAPPSLERSFGNCYTLQAADVQQDKNNHEYRDLVGKIRNTVRKPEDGHIRNQSEFLRELGFPDGSLSVKSGFEYCTVSTWCRFPIYNADYGCGKPAWVATINLPENVTVLLDTESGDGIEAWFTLQKSKAEMFETVSRNTESFQLSKY